MSGYILCQVKRAKNPYYISNISTNIYSIEELCYYLYHNIYLLDETIINEQLLVWMKEELHLRRLYQRLYVLLEEKKNIGEFILPIFKEINYLSHDQFREMNERLKRFEEQPEIVRKKIKGDYLVDHEKYINAIQVYQETLKDTEENETNMGSQFTGSIYNNMGCAYASLFQMNEALTCFQKANDRSFSLIRLDTRLMEQIKSILYELETAISGTQFGDQLLKQALFTEFMVHVNRIFLQKQYITDQRSYSSDSHVEQLVAYINQNLEKDLSIDALAARFFFSKYHMMRKFKNETGYTIHNYITSKRLLMARSLISQGMPVMKAAQASGFHDYTTFVRAYKKQFGKAPSCE